MIYRGESTALSVNCSVNKELGVCNFHYEELLTQDRFPDLSAIISLY